MKWQINLDFNKKFLTMGIPVIQQLRVGAYILKQKILGRSKYPLV